MSPRKRSLVLTAILVLLLPIGAFTLSRVQSEREKTRLETAKRLGAAVDMFVREGRFAEARKTAREWSDLQPDNANAWHELGTIAFAEGDTEAALTALQKAVSLNPRANKAQQALGDVLLARKDYTGAETAYRVALEQKPERPVQAAAQMGLARTLIAQKKDFTTAETLATKAVADEAGNPVNHFVLAETQLAQGKSKDALRAIRRGLALEPASAGGYTLLVLAHRLTGDEAGAKKAEATLTALREYTPNSPNVPDPIRLAQGEALLEEGKYQDALNEFITVLKKDITNAGALEGAGLALWQMNQKSMGSSYLAQSLRHDPERVRARMALGLTAYEQKQYANAATHFRVITDVQPSNAPAWHALGQAYIGQQLHEVEAEEALKRAIQLESDNAVYLLDYGTILSQNGKTTEAEAAYRKALTLAPDNSIALARFGAFLATFPEDKKRTEARGLLENALKTDSQNSYAQFHLGRLLVELGQYADGAKLLERATEGGQAKTKDVWSVLARAYRQMAQRDKASFAIKKAEKIQRDSDRYTKAAERLATNLNDAVARLEMARASAIQDEPARALAEYETYLRRVPNDVAVKKEKEQYMASLKAAGKLPDMTLYNSINTAAKETR